MARKMKGQFAGCTLLQLISGTMLMAEGRGRVRADMRNAQTVRRKRVSLGPSGVEWRFLPSWAFCAVRAVEEERGGEKRRSGPPEEPRPPARRPLKKQDSLPGRQMSDRRRNERRRNERRTCGKSSRIRKWKTRESSCVRAFQGTNDNLGTMLAKLQGGMLVSRTFLNFLLLINHHHTQPRVLNKIAPSSIY